MLNKVEKIKKPKKKLKLYQKVLIISACLVFLIATTILCVIYKEYIFTEQALAYIILIILIILMAIGFIIYKVISNNENK